MHRTARRSLTAAAVTAAAALALVVPAAPSSAGGAGSTRHAATLTFTSGAEGTLTPSGSSLQLTDYATPEYYDRVLGSRSAANPLSIGDSTCAAGGSTPTGLMVYGRETTWANMPVSDGPTGARVEISCVVDGVHHRYHWGNHQNADFTYDMSKTTNCVRLTRATTTTFELNSEDCEEMQVEVRNAKGKQVAGTHTAPAIHFNATLTVPTLK